jgi:ferredoxin/flavodoxin---NADP+ reductase
VGTLVHDALLPGKRIWFFATGTGVAPFASLVRDPETYEKFEEVILTHTCRDVAELKYGEELVAKTLDDPLVGEEAQGKLRYYPTTTRETSPKMGRITTLLRMGRCSATSGSMASRPRRTARWSAGRWGSTPT